MKKEFNPETIAMLKRLNEELKPILGRDILDRDVYEPIGMSQTTFSDFKRAKKTLYSIAVYLWQARNMDFDLKYVMTGEREPASVTSQERGVTHMPLMGYISAGLPITPVAQDEVIEIPTMFYDEDRYALLVSGHSMMDAGVLDEDIIIIHQTPSARQNDLVVALINGDAALKKLVRKSGKIELHPANPLYPVIYVKPDDEFAVQGVVVGVIRKY